MLLVLECKKIVVLALSERRLFDGEGECHGGSLFIGLLYKSRHPGWLFSYFSADPELTAWADKYCMSAESGKIFG